jgi:type IV secretion system protein VirB10
MSDQPLPSERGPSPVASRRAIFRSARNRRIGIAFGGVSAVGLLVLGINAGIHDPGIEHKPADTGSSTIGQVTRSPPAVELPPIVAAPTAAVAPSQPPATVATATPIFVRKPGSSGETFFAPPSPAKASEGEAGGTNGGAKAAATTVAFKPAVLTGAKAGPALRMTYIMRPQLIPCALDTAMDSTLAGAIECHTTQDVLSQDHVRLLPAGTQIMGTYKNDVRSGQSRLFAFAGSAITKEGIPVPLDSQVADGLGMSGIAGDVDNHYMQRFGAAILLSAANAAVSLGQAVLSKGNGNTTLNLNSGDSTSLAQEILRHQIDIPPTITVPPGTVISIVVDHPIDFSDALRVTTP